MIVCVLTVSKYIYMWNCDIILWFETWKIDAGQLYLQTNGCKVANMPAWNVENWCMAFSTLTFKLIC